MSRLSNYGENKFADFIRGQGMALDANWTVHLLGIVDEEGSPDFAILSGTGYASQSSARSLAAWSGTQGAGTTLASSGTSHQTSNNLTIDFGQVGAGGWGTLRGIGLYSGGQLFAYVPVSPRVLLETDTVSFAPGSIVFTLGATGGLTNYFSNILIDMVWRGQAYSMPANLYASYAKTAPTNAAAGQEPNNGAYARVAIPSTLAGWGPTQDDLSTNPSTGTLGRIGNRSAVAFPQPTAYQGLMTHGQLFDAAIGGNFMFWTTFVNPVSIDGTVATPGPAPTFAQDTIGITFA